LRPMGSDGAINVRRRNHLGRIIVAIVRDVFPRWIIIVLGLGTAYQ